MRISGVVFGHEVILSVHLNTVSRVIDDRFITVVKGTWWVGTGTKFDPATTIPMREGTIVKHFGNQVHYDGAKDEEVTVLIVGEGLATSKETEQK